MASFSIAHLNPYLVDTILTELSPYNKGIQSFYQTCRTFRALGQENFKFFKIGKFILSHFELIFSSFSSKPLWFQIKHAKAFLVGEYHLYDEGRKKIGELVSLLWNVKSSLWMEGAHDLGKGQIKHIEFKISEHAKNWDSQLCGLISSWMLIARTPLSRLQDLLNWTDVESDVEFLKRGIAFYKGIKGMDEGHALKKALHQIKKEKKVNPLIRKEALLLAFQVIHKLIQEAKNQQSRLFKKSKPERDKELADHLAEEMQKGKEPIALMGKAHAESELAINLIKQHGALISLCIKGESQPLDKEVLKTFSLSCRDSIKQGNLNPLILFYGFPVVFESLIEMEEMHLKKI